MGQLRLMLWNVENLFIYLDHPCDKELRDLSEEQWQNLSKASTPNKYLNKIFDLKKCILEIDPDILMLNEVGGVESLENFNQYFLASTYTTYLLEGNSDRGIDVGYLVKKDLDFKVSIASHKDKLIDLKFPDDSNKKYYMSRDVSELTLSKNSKPEFIVLLTHLKSKLDPEGIDKEGIIRRTAEAKLLSDIYLHYQNKNPTTPILVAGDFNGVLEDPKHSEFQYMRDKTDLIDVLDHSKDFKVSPRVTQVQFRMNHRTDYQFDYILLSPKFAPLIIPEQTFIDTLSDENGIKYSLPQTRTERFSLPSDHYPVIATLKLK